MMEYYTQDQIESKYDELSLKRKIEVLEDAIDYMQQYNGRSKIRCIALAMGFDNTEGDHTSYFKNL